MVADFRGGLADKMKDGDSEFRLTDTVDALDVEESNKKIVDDSPLKTFL
ncbi:hypothetical protein CCACVL1_22406 [Corchorus capsularis]|uniref:Uncharacterized protein n=1 Tax=Corchorus capsularis TaxID=210143 RepID=A0A1R3GZ65_COCAP|nr:hypothetical protein CCACVL1_22406 [Corchorus capsularis]